MHALTASIASASKPAPGWDSFFMPGCPSLSIQISAVSGVCCNDSNQPRIPAGFLQASCKCRPFQDLQDSQLGNPENLVLVLFTFKPAGLASVLSGVHPAAPHLISVISASISQRYGRLCET